MARHHPLFEGLIVDEYNHPVAVAYVGEEACYVVDDAGFHRHIPAADVDRQVLQLLLSQIEGSEEVIAAQAAKMLGQDDIFSKALIENQLKNVEKQIESVLETGIPEEGRAYIGMLGFQVRINYHGEVVGVDQPGVIDDDER